MFWPAARFKGVVIPLTLNPEPLAVTAEIAMLALPEFASVIVCFPLLPRTMLPKLTLLGVAVSAELVATPVPESEIVWGEFGALSVKLIVPDAAPATVGANCALNDKLWPAAIVEGSERPLTAYPVPETVARFTTRLLLPLLVSFTVCVALWPSVTLPKVTEVGEIVRPA